MVFEFFGKKKKQDDETKVPQKDSADIKDLKEDILNLTNDITSVLRNQSIEREDGKVKFLLHLMAFPIFFIDRNGKIIDFNEKACKLFGYDHDEFSMMEFFNLIPHHSRDMHKRLFKNNTLFINTSITGINRTIQALHKTGKELVVPIIVSKIDLGQDEFMCACVFPIHGP